MGNADSAITIYHNPDCGTSRNTLALIRSAGAGPRIIEYLKMPPPRGEVLGLAKRIGVPLRGIMRRKGTPYDELRLDDPSVGDQELLDAIEAHPILLNRPIVTSPLGTQLCRPSDVVLDLLPNRPQRRLMKEEGVPFLEDVAVSGGHAPLRAALAEEGLPADDLQDPGRTFFLYRALDGEVLGFGGYELYGTDVLLRSILVMCQHRASGIGRNILPLLLFRAFRAGARRAYLLTQSAAPFFEKAGFGPLARDLAPAAIRETRQASVLCPVSAVLMTRKIEF